MVTDNDGLPCVGLGDSAVTLVGVTPAIEGNEYFLTESTIRQGMYYTYGLPISATNRYDVYINGVKSETLSGTGGMLISIV